ncbi:unnamed protein product [Arabis nemorensis]|uniref:DUF4283 domain-containing protein n=1 Tax=Arabis nemorensis TaxID=586526 RepID=A0A565CLM0_9BRAS|nr:unnamed protein product [Arabis nemorensis]
MESQKSIWEVFKGLRLGSDKEPWVLHQDVQDKFEKEHQLCLVVKGLNLDHQNPAGIKKTMMASWAPKGCVDAKVNDDGTVNFYFAKDYQLMNVYENAPYEYRGWMLAVDLWKNRRFPSFLQTIPFWINIEKLPQMYHRSHIIESFASKFGHVDEVRIREPALHLQRPAEVKKLVKFCTTCGSLRHGYEKCPQASTLTATAGALMELGHTLYLTEQERSAAIEGLNTKQDLGESSGAQKDIPEMLEPIADYLLEQGLGKRPAVEADLMMEDKDKGMKRKIDEMEIEESEAEGMREMGKKAKDMGDTVGTISEFPVQAKEMEVGSSEVAKGMGQDKTNAGVKAKGLVVAIKPPKKP